MNSTPQVGVVIPTHRFDHWLDEAVESSIASIGVTIQIVVVANGLDRITERPWMSDDRISILHFTEALGPGGAMLPGLAHLDTEFVARLDADDRMLPERLARQVDYLQAHPETPLVTTSVRRISETGSNEGLIRMPTGPDVRQHLILANRLVHSSFLMRRKSIEEAGSYQPNQLQMEDYDLALRLARLGPIAVLPEVLTEYRIHPGQISKGAKPRGEHIERVLQLRRQLGEDLGMSRLGVGSRNLLWRLVQFTRYYGLTRPGHQL